MSHWGWATALLLIGPACASRWERIDLASLPTEKDSPRAMVVLLEHTRVNLFEQGGKALARVTHRSRAKQLATESSKFAIAAPTTGAPRASSTSPPG